jgi:hypothetical protein
MSGRDLLACILFCGGILVAGTSGTCLAQIRGNDLWALLSWIVGGTFLLSGLGISIGACLMFRQPQRDQGDDA